MIIAKISVDNAKAKWDRKKLPFEIIVRFILCQTKGQYKEIELPSKREESPIKTENQTENY